MSLAAASKHIKVLDRAGLVQRGWQMALDKLATLTAHAI
jgi:hypothetical protein